MWQRVYRNRHRPELIVVDPRKTETAMAATQHYAIKPKSDLFLLYGLANMLIESGSIHREYIDGHTSGFTVFAAFVGSFTVSVVTDDRPHRPARNRRQLHHRPVQRHGIAAFFQYHKSTRRPRFLKCTRSSESCTDPHDRHQEGSR
jgi:anaerobic selenocysteine-containing dehydrogenase